MDNDGTENIWKALEKESLMGVKYHLALDPSNLNKNDVTKNFTPLHWASQEGHLEIAKYLLLSKSAQVDPKNKYNETPLMWACGRGHFIIVNLLLDKGANINFLNIDRDTPLHYAVDGNHLDVVKLLIQRGADTTKRNKCGKAPLDLAISKKHSSILNCLHSLWHLYEFKYIKNMYWINRQLNIKFHPPRNFLIFLYYTKERFASDIKWQNIESL